MYGWGYGGNNHGQMLAYNGTADKIYPGSVVIPKLWEGFSGWNGGNFYGWGHVVEIEQATEDNQRPIGVTGATVIHPGGFGYVSIDGICVVRPYTLPAHWSAVQTLGSTGGSYDPLPGGSGLTIMKPYGYGWGFLCVFNHGVETTVAATLHSGNGSVADGAAVVGHTAQSLPHGLTIDAANGTITADVNGTYNIGFSLTAEGPEANSGDMMVFSIYNKTQAAFINISGAAENFWETRLVASVVTKIDANRPNIAASGVVALQEGDVLEVRNTSGFSVDVTYGTFWISRNG